MSQISSGEALKRGIKAHKLGKLQEADRFYTAILKAEPMHSDANHNMGVLAVSVGKINEALQFFKTALQVNPLIDQYWKSYMDALLDSNRLKDAKALFSEAKKTSLKDDTFYQLEKKLNDTIKRTLEVSKIKGPSKKTVHSLISLYNQGRFADVIFQSKDLLKRFPESVELRNVCGTANVGMKQYDEAIDMFRQALTVNPNHAPVHCNMGNALQEKGDLDSAIKCFTEALKIRPDFVDAYSNMGNALQAKGDLDAAITSYKQAIKIEKDLPFTYNNLALAYKKQGQLDLAIANFKHALQLNPHSAMIYGNIGNALQEKGDLEAAIDGYQQALKINPDYTQIYNNLANALSNVSFSIQIPGLQEILISILNHNTIARPKDLFSAAISQLKFEPSLKKIWSTKPHNSLNQTLHQLVSALSASPLLLKLLSSCPVSDLKLEATIKEVRCYLLVEVLRNPKNFDYLKFQTALALQCFINEYLYTQSDAENTDVEKLKILVNHTVSKGEQPRPEHILCLASYEPLYKFEWCDLLKSTSSIESVFRQQIKEPKQENDLKYSIQILDDITDQVSTKVREQYEENPYPRWVNVSLEFRAKSIPEVMEQLNLRVFDQAILQVKEPKILNAGCGTGQHPIGTAARFKNSKLLAFDLSLSSIAYAKRKTEELMVENIEYIQADILNLRNLDKEFDIVGCPGVLHHMENPIVGWRQLAGCLKPGGLMEIGLYSELGRQHIVKIREEIKSLGIGSSDAEMRSVRNWLIASPEAHHKQIINSNDFYSLSTLRDLLFHVQEHRFTITQLKDCLEELGLKFCGFFSRKIISKFKERYSDVDDLYDLDKWKKYEEEFPKTFSGMYQFWCQKI